jgi:hypothetical protein
MFSRFYSVIHDQMGAWGLSPTFVGAEGAGHAGRLTKTGSPTHSKLVATGFDGVDALSIVANPPKSESPAYDSFAKASLSYVESRSELLSCVVVNDAFAAIRSIEFDRLLGVLVDLCRWDFGYGFSSPVEKQSDFHILGLDSGNLSDDEYQSLVAWYDSTGMIRAASLRDVYPYNVLNERQLALQVSDGVNLRQFAQQQPGCALKPLGHYGLQLWMVSDADISRIRNVLKASRLLIS